MVRWGRENRRKVMMMQMESERSKAASIWEKVLDRSSSSLRRIQRVMQLPWNNILLFWLRKAFKFYSNKNA